MTVHARLYAGIRSEGVTQGQSCLDTMMVMEILCWPRPCKGSRRGGMGNFVEVPAQMPFKRGGGGVPPYCEPHNV